MGFLHIFKRKKNCQLPTPEEELKLNIRILNKAGRDVERQKRRLESQEKVLISEIKKYAKQGDMSNVKIKAKELVQIRHCIKPFTSMKANIQTIKLKCQTFKTQNAMGTILNGVTRTMQIINKQQNLSQMQKTMKDFEREMEMFGMKQEFVENAIDDTLGDDGDEEETDEIVSNVLAELGVQITEQLSGLPTLPNTLSLKESTLAERNVRGQSAAVPADIDVELETRLANLRRQ